LNGANPEFQPVVDIAARLLVSLTYVIVDGAHGPGVGVGVGVGVGMGVGVCVGVGVGVGVGVVMDVKLAVTVLLEFTVTVVAAEPGLPTGPPVHPVKFHPALGEAAMFTTVPQV